MQARSLALFALVLGCGSTPYEGPCDAAAARVAECFASAPAEIAQCDEHVAERVLAMSCDEMQATHSGKADWWSDFLCSIGQRNSCATPTPPTPPTPPPAPPPAPAVPPVRYDWARIVSINNHPVTYDFWNGRATGLNGHPVNYDFWNGRVTTLDGHPFTFDGWTGRPSGYRGHPISYDWTGRVTAFNGHPMTYDWAGRVTAFNGHPVSYEWNGRINAINGDPVTYEFWGGRLTTVDAAGIAYWIIKANGDLAVALNDMLAKGQMDPPRDDDN